MTITERIIALLDGKNESQKSMSAAIGLPYSTVNTWLKHGRDIPAQCVLPICRFLDVTPGYLLEGVDEPRSDKGVAPALTDDEQYLLSLFHDLDREGVHVVLNCAIEERRRVVTEGIGTSTTAESS